MTGSENDFTIETIPVVRITVLNPRVRDKKKFLEIVDSIAKVGLKQPIKVSRVKGPDGEAAYNLVYGQGRPRGLHRARAEGDSGNRRRCG